MYEVGMLAVGLIVGGVVAWVVAAARARAGEAVAEEVRKQLEGSREEAGNLQAELRAVAAGRAAAEARAAAMQASLEEQKALLEDAKGKLTDAFKALAAEALKSSNQDFLALAETRFAALKQEAGGELEARKTAIETLVQPLRQALEDFQRETKELEEKRLREVAGVGQQQQAVAQALMSVQAGATGAWALGRDPSAEDSRAGWNGEALRLRRTGERCHGGRAHPARYDCPLAWER